MAENEIFPESPGATYGELLPLKRNPDGSLAMAWPGFVHGMVNSAYNALVAPGETLTGRTPSGNQLTQLPDPQKAAWDITGTMLGAGLGAPVPAGSSRVFGGLGARTADQRAFNTAIDMHQAGAAPEQIWKNTGWFKDVDNHWKFEIPDTQAYYTGKSGPNLSDTLHHPELYRAYPELADTPISSMPGRGGVYDPNSRSIQFGAAASLGDTTSTLLHETQHGIQHREGFAAGGSPDDFLPFGAESWNKEWDNVIGRVKDSRKQISDLGHDSGAVENGIGKTLLNRPLSPVEEKAVVNFAQEHPELANEFSEQLTDLSILHGQARAAHNAYHNLAGEVEARNVQERWENRYGSETPPWMTQGYVPKERQIVQDAYGRPMFAEPVEHDPFNMSPVEHNPFTHSLSPVDHNPFEK